MSLRRSLGVALWASVLVACGALTGLDEYSEGAALSADGGTASSSSSGGSSSGTASSSSSSGGSTSGGSDGGSSGIIDAARDTWVEPCPKFPGRKLENESCARGTDCCGERCSFAYKCKSDCKNAGACGSNNDCCVGLYCSGFQCTGCRPPGVAAEVIPIVGPWPDSCCSRALNGSNCK